MISRSTRRGLILAAVLAAGSYILVQRQDAGLEPPTQGLDTRLDYALERFELRAYDTQGLLAMRLWAPRLTNNADSNIGQIQQPRLEVSHEGFKWHIMADSGVISADQEEVFLAGKVRVRREGALAADQLEIDTRDVTLTINERTARSTAALRVQDLAGEVEGRGFFINMLSNEFQLDNDVRARFELPN